jgi:RimJ/RimL family protein N-acetyltransferase
MSLAERTHGKLEMKQGPDYFAPVILIGERVRLEPLSRWHTDDLSVAGAQPDIWRWLPTEHYLPGSMASFIDAAVSQYAQRKAVPFATIDMQSSRAVGSTRFHFIEPEQRRLEIGVTWVASALQRSHVNTEAKLLQLWYAFEVLECRRVEFKADADNSKSRSAILRLGAKEEGYFRKHMLYPDGRNRDSVYFSIIDDEWAASKALLLSRLGYDVRLLVAGGDRAS